MDIGSVSQHFSRLLCKDTEKHDAPVWLDYISALA